MFVSKFSSGQSFEMLWWKLEMNQSLFSETELVCANGKGLLSGVDGDN